MATAMDRLEAVALALPEAQRVDVEAWDGEPTFRVRGKNFVFTDPRASRATVKLSKAEAEAVVATVDGARPASYGLGRAGWVVVPTPPPDDSDAWTELAEWVTTSYCLIAPKTLARQVTQS